MCVSNKLRRAWSKYIGVDAARPQRLAGIKAGDVIEKCDGEKIATVNDFRRAVAVAELDVPIAMQVSSEGKSREAKLTVVTWPKEIPSEMPPVPDEVEDNMVTEVVDLTLGDFPNKAFAVIPPLAQKRTLGVLVLYPEPGEWIERKCRQLSRTSHAIKVGSSQ